MPRPVPFELQVIILDHLFDVRRLSHSPFDDPFLSPRDPKLTVTLKSCCLVCSSWLPICRRRLMQDLCFHTRSQVDEVLSALTSGRAELLCQEFTTRLILRAPQASRDRKAFHHVAIHHLSRRLTSLQTLCVIGDRHTTFQVPTTLTMHMGQMRTLTTFHLVKHTFQSFWDLRRLVTSLPILCYLKLIDVTWPPPLLGASMRLPSLLKTASRLSQIVLEGASSGWEVLLFWTTTAQPKHSESILRRGAKCPYPALTVEDVSTIEVLLRMCWRSVENSVFSWEYSDSPATWKLTCRGWMCSPVFVFEVLARRSAALAESQERRIGRVYSVSYTSVHHGALPLTEWAEEFDRLVNRFSELRGVQLFFNMGPPTWRPLEDPHVAFHSVIRAMDSLAVRLNVSLTCTIDENPIPWVRRLAMEYWLDREESQRYSRLAAR